VKKTDKRDSKWLAELCLNGKNIDEILKMITSKRILKKEQELRQAVANTLDPARILLIRTYLELIEKIEIEKILFAYFGKERKEKSYRCIGKKSSLHIASSPGERRKISG
jgi:hypothetical protein